MTLKEIGCSFASQGQLAMSGDFFWSYLSRRCYWHKTALSTKNDPAQVSVVPRLRNHENRCTTTHLTNSLLMDIWSILNFIYHGSITYPRISVSASFQIVLQDKYLEGQFLGQRLCCQGGLYILLSSTTKVYMNLHFFQEYVQVCGFSNILQLPVTINYLFELYIFF